MKDNILLEVKNLCKSFKENDVLKGINIDIIKGDVVAVIGPSGCGKSTLLRCLNLLEIPTDGEILFHNQYVFNGLENKNKISKEINLHRQKIGMVFQQFNLFPHLTVMKNITLAPVKLKKMTNEEAEKKALELLEKVGLQDRANDYPSALSGGMKQRVAIIRSLLNHSPILLMDEPFSALDMQNRHKLQEQLIGVWKRFENTIVFVTHDVDEAVYLADKIVIMDKKPGRIAEIIEVDIERPRKRESDEFIQLQESIVDKLDMEE